MVDRGEEQALMECLPCARYCSNHQPTSILNATLSSRYYYYHRETKAQGHSANNGRVRVETRESAFRIHALRKMWSHLRALSREMACPGRSFRKTILARVREDLGQERKKHGRSCI
jgi:hypothetical protein